MGSVPKHPASFPLVLTAALGGPPGPYSCGLVRIHFCCIHRILADPEDFPGTVTDKLGPERRIGVGR